MDAFQAQDFATLQYLGAQESSILESSVEVVETSYLCGCSSFFSPTRRNGSARFLAHEYLC